MVQAAWGEQVGKEKRFLPADMEKDNSEAAPPVCHPTRAAVPSAEWRPEGTGQSSVKLQEIHWKTPTGPLQPPEPPGTGWPSSACPCLSRAPPDTDCPAGHRAEPPHQGHVPAVVPPKPPL